MSIQGGCLCGTVRYECSKPALLQFSCHCHDCQRSTGAAYAPVAFFPAESVLISGKVRYFQSFGGSGKTVSRGFCPGCGSQLFGLVDVLPALISVRAGTFDNPAIFQPKANLFVSHAAPWNHIDHALATFLRNAPQGGQSS